MPQRTVSSTSIRIYLSQYRQMPARRPWSSTLSAGTAHCILSKRLSDTEKHYTNIEQELLALIFACEQFHTYLYGRTTNIILWQNLLCRECICACHMQQPSKKFIADYFTEFHSNYSYLYTDLYF